jgi:hypothetical protein
MKIEICPFYEKYLNFLWKYFFKFHEIEKNFFTRKFFFWKNFFKKLQFSKKRKLMIFEFFQKNRKFSSNLSNFIIFFEFLNFIFQRRKMTQNWRNLSSKNQFYHDFKFYLHAIHKLKLQFIFGDFSLFEKNHFEKLLTFFIPKPFHYPAFQKKRARSIVYLYSWRNFRNFYQTSGKNHGNFCAEYRLDRLLGAFPTLTICPRKIFFFWGIAKRTNWKIMSKNPMQMPKRTIIKTKMNL